MSALPWGRGVRAFGVGVRGGPAGAGREGSSSVWTRPRWARTPGPLRGPGPVGVLTAPGKQTGLRGGSQSGAPPPRTHCMDITPAHREGALQARYPPRAGTWVSFNATFPEETGPFRTERVGAEPALEPASCSGSGCDAGFILTENRPSCPVRRPPDTSRQVRPHSSEEPEGSLGS